MITKTGAKWTADQERAIRESGSTLLVSAAAGSGKTSVLVERIIQRLTRAEDPFDVDEFLVVTFTEAAAAEMRRRIGEAIAAALRARPEDAHLQRQLALLPRAAISTLHAFCKRVLRRYFNRTDLDPGFTVLGEHEALLVQDDILDELLEQHYAASDAADPGGFLDLVDRYGGERGDRDLRRLILTLYQHSRSLPFPDRWLDDLADAFAAPGDLGRWLQPARLTALDRACEAERLLARSLRRCRQPGGPAWLVPTLEREIGIAQAVRAALEAGGADQALTAADLAAIRQAVGAIVFADLRGGSKADKQGDDPAVRESVIASRKQARDALMSLRDTPLGAAESAERARQDLLELAPAMGQLRSLVRAFAAGFRDAKRRRNAVDFNDLEHLTLALLQDADSRADERPAPSEVATDLRDRFREILVDEYQDTNPVQEAILTLIARPDDVVPGESGNLFLVGDVKQSIYRFRMADPSLFLRRLAAYPAEGPGPRRIDLQANFRSRQGVVDAVNFLFRQIMTPDLGGLAYDSRAELVCQAAYGGEDPPVELHIVGGGAGAIPSGSRQDAGAPRRPSDGQLEGEPPLAETAGGSRQDAGAPRRPSDGQPAGEPPLADAAGGSRLEREAAAVAARLRRLFAEGLVVHDRREGTRALRYSDVVVLLRAANADAPVFVEALTQAGIPVHAQAASGYFAAVEVLTMLSLLDIIDNPRQDIPLAAVLRSPIVGLDTADLARIRLAKPSAEFFDALAAAAKSDERVAGFLERLDTWRTAARRGPLSDLVWRLLSETGFLAFAAGLPGGSLRRANLLALHDRAREFDHFTRQGLFRFLRFIRRLQDAGEDLGMASAAGENADVVRIMSTHRSKGLEFPVVVAAGLGKRWNLGDLQGDLLLDREIGLGPRVVDPARRIKYPSFAHQVVKERSRRQMVAEEMRVLYVALTRAKERLILVGSADDPLKWSDAADFGGPSLPPDLLAGASCPLDWIGAAVARHTAGDALRQPGQVPADAAVAHDPSTWRITAGTPIQTALRESAGTPSQAALPESAGTPIQAAVPEIAGWAAGTPPLLDPGSDLTPAARAVADRLSWAYPYRALTRCPAKVAASQAPSEAPPALTDAEEAPHPAAIRPVLLNRPRFVQADARKLTASERGTATHLLMQHLEFAADAEPAALARRLEDLVVREVIAPEAAAAIDRAAVLEFLASPLGLRLAAAEADPQAHVMREVPFSIRAAAAEIQPDLPAGQAAGEWVLVQGMIDCLLHEADGITILDYKTDEARGRPLQELAAEHRPQMQRYRTAAAAMFGVPVKTSYLVFLAAGQAVEV